MKEVTIVVLFIFLASCGEQNNVNDNFPLLLPKSIKTENGICFSKNQKNALYLSIDHGYIK